MSGLEAPAELVRVAGFCNQWGLDLTAGCRHACAYCHFQKYQALTLRQAHDGRELADALSVEEFLGRPEYPPELYLSPFTDPLAPAARANLERVLWRVLPLSVKVGISTKGVVPRRIFRLLAAYPEQVRLIVGLTSLDDSRNAAVEPGCPPAQARLANLRLAKEYGLKKVTARLDPLLPGVDDAAEQLTAVLDRVAEAGAQSVTASYLFLSPIGSKQRLRQVPYLGQAIDQCTELCPIEGGTAYSVPLDRKGQMYEWFHRACAARGLYFGTCGCKDLRLASGPFATACSYPYLSACAAPTLIHLDRRAAKEKG
jgi:DNA repair photolyase